MEFTSINSISPQRREKFFKVLDGEQQLLPLIFFLSKSTRVDQMLDWLIQHKITGKALIEWVKLEQNQSFLFTAQEITKWMDGDREYRVLEFGKDFKE